ncbi:uncharacterized protein LOC118480996 [Helianthus annuus]|uniref:uncharacterized protein LOC118480996 n=1 Tax=Helianthus annuus TaxID=4232 RepID=UPI001652D4B7|nr:uncharacterized protein LOC118480996 [Helianthus annuus]
MNFFSFNIRGLRGGEKAGWVKKLKSDFGVSFISLQETKRAAVSQVDLHGFRGNNQFGFDSVDSVGLSGGLACLWDKSIFSQSGGTKDRNFLHVRGKIKGSGVVVNVLNVYAPQGVPAKKLLWDSLVQLISSFDGLWVVSGDFNAVRFREEKRNCSFKNTCANNFNTFIFEAGLLEYNMKGRSFTYASADGRKLSKLDRFLVNPAFFNSWPEARVEALSSFLSDHCPIILSSVAKNFGPKPFRVFDSWIGLACFEEEVVGAIKGSDDVTGPPDVVLMKKLGILRQRLKLWRDDMLAKNSEAVASALSDLEGLEAVLDSRELNEEEEWSLLECKKLLKEEEVRKNRDLKQRSRIRWAKEGDENSKFFHSMINCRKASNVIHGLNIDGCGSSFIALIPKIKDPLGLKDYRPISLVGIINKVISKVLANRLKRVLNSIISHSQSAFIGGRFILDGPLIINEIHNWAKKVKKKVFFLKIDFEKAYDNVNWNFVVDILSQMGFPSRWCAWVRGIISSARASVLVNGAPTFEFKCNKGMRQGDPISPFLFVIVMEALSCLISTACHLGIFKGVDLPNDGPSLSHLFFADDAIIL